MADTTSHETELTRAEAADLLRSIADELDSDRRRIRVGVGNKEVQLSPPERIGAAMTVTERSRRIRKNVEKLDLEFNWNPVTTKDESAPDGETDPQSNPEPDR